MLVLGKAGWHQSGTDACLDGAGVTSIWISQEPCLGRRAVLAEHFRMDPKAILSLGKLDGASGMTEKRSASKEGEEEIMKIGLPRCRSKSPFYCHSFLSVV